MIYARVLLGKQMFVSKPTRAAASRRMDALQEIYLCELRLCKSGASLIRCVWQCKEKQCAELVNGWPVARYSALQTSLTTNTDAASLHFRNHRIQIRNTNTFLPSKLPFRLHFSLIAYTHTTTDGIRVTHHHYIYIYIYIHMNYPYLTLYLFEHLMMAD
jgi:hypothetical protein